ncbi:MAG: group 1 truncated hemoglobin, partial [Proteobacteria bacterium]|nr:group 1 truncated hemoglobin [Pseudomonadota bacterium]
MDIKSSAAEAVEQPNQSLFDRLGGAAAVDAAVDLFYRKVLSDPTVNRFFDLTDMEGQRAKQRAFLTMAFGGPNDYTGKDLRTAHAPLVAKGLNETHFGAIAKHLQDTLFELKLPNDLIGEVMNIAASTKNDVLAGDPNAAAAPAAPAAGSSVTNSAEELQQMLNNMPINVMVCDPHDLTITYINETSIKTLKQLEHLLPVKADKLLGQCIDIFHKDPSFQRGILSNPNNLPHQANIKIGDETLDLLVTAVRDHDNNYVAAMLTWSIITEKVKADAASYRLEQMVSTMPVNVMMLEIENFTITYANETSITTLKQLEHLLPSKADELVGQCVDIFHKDPSFQRRILADPKNLPHKAIIKVGDESLDLLVSAVHDRDGNYIAAMLTWSVVTEKLKQEAEAQRLQQMIEGMPINVMMCDPDTLELNYLNKQSRETLKSIEHLLPVKAEDMFGQCIDIFHKDPAHQRRLLADPKNLPHKAKIELGEHTLSLDVSAVMGPNGEYIGPMVAWSVITDQINMANDVAKVVDLVA